MTPFDPRELTVLVSALFVAAGSMRYRTDLQRVPDWRLLALAMGFLVLGGTCTLIEHAIFYSVFNVIEHLAYLLQSVTLAAWAYRLQKVPR